MQKGLGFRLLSRCPVSSSLSTMNFNPRLALSSKKTLLVQVFAIKAVCLFVRECECVCVCVFSGLGLKRGD